VFLTFRPYHGRWLVSCPGCTKERLREVLKAQDWWGELADDPAKTPGQGVCAATRRGDACNKPQPCWPVLRGFGGGPPWAPRGNPRGNADQAISGAFEPNCRKRTPQTRKPW